MGKADKTKRLIQETERMQSLAGIITENFKSLFDEGFDEAREKYISRPFLKDKYNNLNGSGKLLLINKVRSILNGSPSNMKLDSYSSSSFSLMVADVVACMAVESGSERERQNAYNFLMGFYNPYPVNAGQSSTGKFAPVVSGVLPSTFDFGSYRYDELMDMLSDAFFDGMDYLIKKGKYDPGQEKEFSFIFPKMTWRNRFINKLKSFAKKKSRYAIPQDTLPDTRFDAGTDDNDDDDDDGGPVLNNDQKIDLIASKASPSEKKILYAWYEWYRQNADSKDSMISDLTKKNDKVTAHLVKALPEYAESSITGILSRLRIRIEKMIKDKGFREKLGLDTFSAKRIDVSDILKGTQRITESSLRNLVATIIREGHGKKGLRRYKK